VRTHHRRLRFRKGEDRSLYLHWRLGDTYVVPTEATMVMQDASGTRSTTASIDTNGVMLFSWTGATIATWPGPGAFEVHVTANGQTTIPLAGEFVVEGTLLYP